MDLLIQITTYTKQLTKRIIDDKLFPCNIKMIISMRKKYYVLKKPYLQKKLN